jgi:hypothetical protein
MLVLCGCGFSAQELGADAAPGAPGIDARVPQADGGGDAAALDAPPGAAFCAGTFTRACADVPPTENVTLDTQTIDTGSSTLCRGATVTPSFTRCVIIGQSITVPPGATITVVGLNPLILLADTITISGTLDAASHRGMLDGPGADASFCATNFVTPNTGSGEPDGGGGFGGSFGAKGGNGGGGAKDGAPGVAPDGLATTTSLLHGGCKGAAGAGTGGVEGHGGGAVTLIAKTSVMIAGTVNASGASGAGGKTSGGGGGGGSGGMIVLDAPTVNVTGQCFANGGGGGEGANANANGEDGHESASPGTAGAGGLVGTNIGGDGGAGGAGTSPVGTVGVKGVDGGGGAIGGGGGGGGSVGIIKVISSSATGTNDLAKVSPAPS